MLTKDRLIRLCNARDQLQQVGHDELSIADIANTAAMSRFHFIRQFKAVFGETPIRLRTRSRLDEAKQRLVGTDESVTDICMAVGFSSLGSFSTLFAKRFGQSPSSYRRALSGCEAQLKPDCMTLMRGSWESEAQISRSPDGG